MFLQLFIICADVYKNSKILEAKEMGSTLTTDNNHRLNMSLFFALHRTIRF